MRRIYPALATTGLIIVGMVNSTWGVRFLGKTAWALPDDLWGTLTAAQRLVHLHVSGLYTPPTGLVSFPGTALILAPVVAFMDVAGISLHPQTSANPYPASWLAAGPYTIAIACVTLFAADALAERMRLTGLPRLLLAAAGAIAVWSVTVRWGHPEDAVAVGLLLYGILALDKERRGPAGWLIGAALLVQPLVVLAIPVILVAVWRGGEDRLRGVPTFSVRAVLPSAVALGIAAAANWHATVSAITNQPNFPAIDHPTPWTSLSPHLSGGAVAAGPGRLLAIGCACACGVAYACLSGRRRLSGRRPGVQPRTGSAITGSAITGSAITGGASTESAGADGGGAGSLSRLLWWVAVCLALRCVFESVMVSYYLWPALQICLVVAAQRPFRLVVISVLTSAVTFGSQVPSRGPWLWWSLMTAGLVTILACSWNVRSAAGKGTVPLGPVTASVSGSLEG
jgi:hypothetical protein